MRMMGMSAGACVDRFLANGGAEGLGAHVRASRDADLSAAREMQAAVAAATTPGIPPLRTDGRLPDGVHMASWGEFLQRFATTPQRESMAHAARQALLDAREAGVRVGLIGGSFPSAKPVPGDIDMAAVLPPGVGLPRVRPGEFAAGARLYAAHHRVVDRQAFADPKPPAAWSFRDLLAHDREHRPFGMVAIPLDSM